MTKYRQAVQEMLEENKELFEEFKPIHDAYALNPEINQAKYNDSGKEILDVLREYDRRLCAKMGGGQYSKFSTNLSEKFWEEVRKIFPLIDRVGIR
ncbi:MAG: hypothetical protein Q7S76_00435 [bacterium]|nr:hypothetical protein [bacterium]